MISLILMGGLVAIGTIILSHKLGIRKVAGNDIAADIVLSVGLAVLFAGTMSGLMIAAIAGIIVSLYLIAVKKTVQVERLSFHGLKPQWVPVS